MKKIRLMAIIILSLLIIPFAVNYTSGSALAAGKPDRIIFGCIPDMTGPYAPIVGPAYAALTDAAEYVNENGGIAGVPLEVFVREQEVFDQLVSKTRLPVLTLDVSDNDTDTAVEKIADWLHATGLIWADY